jgi:hypothetical protein
MSRTSANPIQGRQGETSSRLPDFIIGGAMKAGTTTLHHLLARHPDVFIPRHELQVFVLDDSIAERAKFHRRPRAFDFDREVETWLPWYRAFFADARPDQLVGERSTLYMASPKAPERIARLMPDVKLIFQLRDPVKRTYSQYWHMVGNGRAIRSFDQTLRYAPDTVLERSRYQAQIEAFMQWFPRENIKVLLFEKFIEDQRGTLDEVTGFLGLCPGIDLAGAETHRNRGERQRFPRFRLLQNRLLRSIIYYRPMPRALGERRPLRARVAAVVRRAMQKANRGAGRYPEMRPETRAYLEQLLARENAGLGELIGIDLRRYWPYF